MDFKALAAGLLPIFNAIKAQLPEEQQVEAKILLTATLGAYDIEEVLQPPAAQGHVQAAERCMQHLEQEGPAAGGRFPADLFMATMRRMFSALNCGCWVLRDGE